MPNSVWINIIIAFFFFWFGFLTSALLGMAKDDERVDAAFNTVEKETFEEIKKLSDIMKGERSNDI